MDKDFAKVMLTKSDLDLTEIESNYKKYTKDALIALLNELKARKIKTTNVVDIENWIKELEVRNMNIGKTSLKVEPHPNIQRAAKLLLLGIPISILQLIITALYFYQLVGNSFFRQILSSMSLALILVWIIIIVLAAWIKSGTSISRIIIGILTALSIVTNISAVYTSREEILSALVPIINLVINCYILYLLFNRESSNWYASRKNTTKDTTAGSNL